MTRDFGYAVFDIGIAYGEDLDRVIDLLRKLGDEMRQDKAFARDIPRAHRGHGHQPLSPTTP